MKSRSGLVGRKGLGPLLADWRGRIDGLKVHLVGHSFGGRLVTSAAAVSGPFDSMSLLQAAFSHNGLGQKYDGRNDGFFRNVITENRILGNIVVTHTKADKAVGQAYAVASRLSGDSAAALGIGDERDKYGGIGRNGALTSFTPEAVKMELLLANPKYFRDTGKKVINLNSDGTITNHGDVRRPEVVKAVLAGIAGT
jgi:pimeloyl-ACP methyl ester carboxylesterase